MNKKKIIVKIEKNNVGLQLLDEKGKALDSLKWQENNDMSTKLLEGIDTLLKSNKIEVSDLEKIDVISDQQSYTSTRIAKAVAKTVDYCLS